LKLQITIEGRTYVVDVEVLEDDETSQAPNYAPQHAGSTSSIGTHGQGNGWDNEGKVCHSPLMGLVIKVNAKQGQTVEAGEILLVLEAMKMETNIAAPNAGTVKNVFVAQGDSVKQNQILIEFD
jgi:methylmalonyl-CoA carboxyltransferase 1.3S subunit